jgi:hypothetical protein
MPISGVEPLAMDRFLCSEDAERVRRTLQKLSRHDVSGWALSGGLAVEIHCLRAGLPQAIRPLNDIDFIAAAFDHIPQTLAGDFLFRHVHPFDPAGKIMSQFVDAETALRIDLFRADVATISRAIPVDIPARPVKLASAEDVLAHAARLLLDTNTAAKHAEDYLRLANFTSAAEAAWQSHRKAHQPAAFEEANARIRSLIQSGHNVPIAADYSMDVTEICPRCVLVDAFPLTDPSRVLALLGYC